ncbi:MAG: Fe2+-dependent dioxygenase [Porticoccaceae bacterium]
MLIAIDKVLDRQVVAEMYRILTGSQWQDGKLTAGGQAVEVKHNLQLDGRSEVAATLGRTILQALAANPLFMSAALPKKIFPPKFNCYRNGGHYGLHVDNAILYLPDQQAMRTDLSATLFLSAPNDYEGGELVIEDQYGAQEVKLDAGSMILYPSTSLHEVRAVTAGARICAFFWIESLVRDSQQRSVLFDLDQSIQQLTTERGASDSEVRRLSGVYHNLVRGWADS